MLAPQSFYDSFPGLGRAWVAIDGPYNEHLVRDIGALNLALLVVLIVAAVRLSRDTLMIAAGATAAWGVPHLLYHVFNIGDLPAGESVASIGGLVAFVAFAAAIFSVARNPSFTSPAPG